MRLDSNTISKYIPNCVGCWDQKVGPVMKLACQNHSAHEGCFQVCLFCPEPTDVRVDPGVEGQPQNVTIILELSRFREGGIREGGDRHFQFPFQCSISTLIKRSEWEFAIQFPHMTPPSDSEIGGYVRFSYGEGNGAVCLQYVEDSSLMQFLETRHRPYFTLPSVMRIDARMFTAQERLRGF